MAQMIDRRVTAEIEGDFVVFLIGMRIRDRFIASRRAEAATVFERGIERGELRPDLDVGVAIDALYGAVYYRLLVSHAPLDPAYADTLIDQVFPAFGQPE